MQRLRMSGGMPPLLLDDLIARAGTALPFIGAFAKLPNATISFIMSILQYAWNNSDPIGRILMKLDI